MDRTFSPWTSRTLLQAYLTDHSEAAFRELVERQMPLVYGAALRLALPVRPSASR